MCSQQPAWPYVRCCDILSAHPIVFFDVVHFVQSKDCAFATGAEAKAAQPAWFFPLQQK